MGLALRLADIPPSGGIDPDTGLVRKTAYGKGVSLTHAVFPAGYSSVPHAYEGEELAQVIQGELSVYIDGLEFKLREGDFLRIPALAVHWKRNRSEEPTTVLELHNPPTGGPGAGSLLDTFEREDASFGGSPPLRFGQTYRASRYYADGEDDFPEAPDDHFLRARADDVWAGVVPQTNGTNHGNRGETKTTRVGGETMAILLGERIGFKMRPHFHAAEQISYVVSGEVWTFVDDRVFYSQPGDFIRVPGNVVHWASVEPTSTAFTWEVHTPLQGDPVEAKGITWLVPPHRVPNLSWIPGGFINDALPVDELEAYESGLLQATKESLKLQPRAPQGVKPTGARL
jgi:quercetin dioxygenase-like cupin family protein